jgi:hypothetical protein
MKGRGFIMMGMLAHAGVINGVPLPSFGKPTELLTIEADLHLTGDNSAVGSFEASGLFCDKGNASDEFYISKERLDGVKTLVGILGTVTIKFANRLSWTGQKAGEANGRFEIVSCTGAYQNLYRVGEAYIKVDLVAGRLLASCTGFAYNY